MSRAMNKTKELGGRQPTNFRSHYLVDVKAIREESDGK